MYTCREIRKQWTNVEQINMLILKTDPEESKQMAIKILTCKAGIGFELNRLL